MKKIDLFGYIGEYYDEDSKGVISAQKLIDELESANGDDVELRVFSKGGDFFEASAMHAAIAMYEGKVDCKIIGIAASAASFFIMACDKITMESTAQLMIHNAHTGAYGDKNAMRKTADELEVIQQGMVQAYMDKTGIAESDMQSMLDKETWMGADKALEMGFIDEVFTAKKEERVAASVTAYDKDKLNYKRVPDGLLVSAVAGNKPKNQKPNNTMDINANAIVSKLGVNPANGNTAVQTSDVLAKINELQSKADKLNDVEASLSDAQAKLAEFDQIKAEYDQLAQQSKEYEAEKVVASTLEEEGVALSDDHAKELKARALEYIEASDDKKPRIKADMSNYVKVNGIEEGMAGIGSSTSRASFDSGEQSYEDKLESIVAKLTKDNPSMDTIEAYALASEKLAEDETAKKTVIH